MAEKNEHIKSESIDEKIKKAELKRLKAETKKLLKESKPRIREVIIASIALFISGWFFVTEIYQPASERKAIEQELVSMKNEKRLILLEDSLDKVIDRFSEEKHEFRIQKNQFKTQIDSILYQLKVLSNKYNFSTNENRLLKESIEMLRNKSERNFADNFPNSNWIYKKTGKPYNGRLVIAIVESDSGPYVVNRDTLGNELTQ